MRFFSVLQRGLCSFIFVFFIGCSSNNTEPTNDILVEKKPADNPHLPFDQRLKQFIERKIGTQPNEHYRLKTYREKDDVFITVNRLENAMKTAQHNKHVQKAEAIGFFGNHNYCIYYNAKTNTFSDPIVVASSPQRELELSFEYISSSEHKDLIIDYTIRNSQFRKIYLLNEGQPTYVFHWKRYDGWGTEQVEAYCFGFAESSHTSSIKDIIVYKATIENIKPTDDYYQTSPKIKCSSTVSKRFFYNPSDRKYYTKNLD